MASIVGAVAMSWVMSLAAPSVMWRLEAFRNDHQRSKDNEVHWVVSLVLLAPMLCSATALSLGTVAPYGRYSGVKSLGLSWGPPINGKVAWVVQEAPSFFAPIVCLWLEHWTVPARGNFLLLGLFLLHYLNRSFIYPLRLRRAKPTPLWVAASAFAFTALNGDLQGHKRVLHCHFNSSV